MNKQTKAPGRVEGMLRASLDSISNDIETGTRRLAEAEEAAKRAKEWIARSHASQREVKAAMRLLGIKP